MAATAQPTGEMRWENRSGPVGVLIQRGGNPYHERFHDHLGKVRISGGDLRVLYSVLDEYEYEYE